MKKQILILTFLSLAFVFAGLKSYGQELNYLEDEPTWCVPALPLTCGDADNALAPLPGVSYPYTVSSNVPVSTVHWFVTDEAAIIDAGGIIAAIETDDGTGDYILAADDAYDDPANTSLTVNITWKSFDGTANRVLLVAYIWDEISCTNNIEVYRIEPEYSFTLDIAGIMDDGTEGNSECVSPVVSATYDGTNLLVDYGFNYVFFAVNAANWQTSWMPDNFDVTASGGSTATIEGWAYPDESHGTGATWRTVGTDQVEATHYASHDNGFIGSDGECIIVRVRVDHGNATETLVASTVNLTVNGEMINPENDTYDGTYPDLDNDGDDCVSDLTSDNADYIITPRPDITAEDPTPFEDKTPSDNP